MSPAASTVTLVGLLRGRVDDIVVELGNSLYQRAVDNYIAGAEVPFEQVERA